MGAVAVLPLFSPSVAFAGHAMNEGNACYDCHDLNSVNVEPDTSLLSSSKRNISSIRAAWAVAGNKNNGKNVPDEFGCLYCHNSPVLKDDPDVVGTLLENKMRDASNHFRDKASAHPVGYDLTTSTDKSGHLLSTFDCKTDAGVYYGQGSIEENKCAVDGVFYTAPGVEDGRGDRAVELDCVDCHDVTQGTGFVGYPGHGKPLATNPLMLRAGAGGYNLATGEYDDHCRRCHGSATGAGATGIAAFKSTGKNLRLTVHQDASDVTTNVLKEYDGTLLKPADRNNDGVADALTLTAQKKQCASCHATHYSSTNKKLFATGMDVSNGSKCTDCHFPGDNNNLAEGGNFVKHGHGKASIGFGCSSCHSVNADHDPAYPVNGPKMFGFSPDTTVSKYGKDLTSICKTCHPPAQYSAHTGGGLDVGCIDCHDEHAEGVGTTSNNYMIPRYLPNIYPRTPGVNVELSFFQSNGLPTSVEPGVYDYYVANANARKVTDMGAEASAGACDNSICHAGIAVTGTPISPLSTFMTSGKHTGSNQTAGTGCSGCHKHVDTGGSWAANGSCVSCHGMPPVSTATSAAGYIFYASNTDESKTPHTRHVIDYGFGCKECHFMSTTKPPHDSGSFESIWFDPARNMDAVAYPTAGAYTVASSTCNSLYCHSDGQRHKSGGSVGSAVWMTGQQTPDWSLQDLACNSCHGTSNGNATLVTYGAPDHTNGTLGNTANSHVKHTFACAVCHNDTIKDMTFADGWTLAAPLSGIPHVNGSKSLKADGTTATFTYTPGATVDLPGSCATISCHGGNGATWGGAALSCDQCHFSAADLNNFNLSDGTASSINSAEWTTTGHGRTTAYPGGNVAAGFVSTAPTDLKGCMYCHDGAVPHATATNPFRLRNKNALAQGLTAGNAFGWNDVCLICHSTLPAATGVDPDGASGAYAPRNAQAVDDVSENHHGSLHSVASQGGTFCWDCHDPHGDTNQFMFQGPNGGAPGNGVTQTSAGSGVDYYGVPVTSRNIGPFDVLSGAGTPANWNSNDYVNASFTGICQVCHTTAANYNQTTFTPLASHQTAATARCTTCHTHTSDFASGCDTCHGNPPLPRPTTGTTQTWVSDNAAGTQGDHTAHNTYGITNCNATCHVVTTHAQNKTSANMGTRAATAATSTGVHQYSTVDNVDVWTGNTAGITSVVDDSCANVNCHNSTYSANAYKSAANPTYVRYWNNTFDCYSCHAYDGQADSTIRPGVQTSVTADWIATGSHDQHINRNGYALACTNCHDTTGYTAARAALHGNGSVNFITNFGAVRTGGVATLGVYDANGATGGWAQIAPFTPTSPAHNYYCGNVYCHSTGEPRGTLEAITYANTTPAQWGVPTTGDCGDCHTVTGSALVTNVHEKHTGPVASSQYNYSCQTCHNSVVNAVPAIVSFPLHVNGTNNVAFLATETGATYATTGGTVAPVGGTCSATYCHSAGLDWTAPYSVEASNLQATVADWDITQNTFGCAGCHGSPPAYANGATVTPGATPRAKANSHNKHSTFGCQICHYGTTTNGTSIVATTGVALHGNKAWNLQAQAGEFVIGIQGNMNLEVYTATRCDTITCHGGGQATWGATLACSACHDGNGATVAENTGILGDGNATPNEVDQAQFTTTGHGRTSAYTSETGGGANNLGANLSCNSSNTSNPVGGCHQPGAAHVPNSATDPWRLVGVGPNYANTTTATDGLNALCLYCHPTATENVATHHSSITGGGTSGLTHTQKCIDCHDPHGDTNIFMMHNRVANDSSGTDGTASDAYGMPETTVATSFLAWNPTANTSDLDLLAGTNQLCEVCHTGTPTTAHNGGAGNPGHGSSYQGTNCISCHTHKDGFKGGGCDGCHGGGNNTVAAPNFYPDGDPAATYEDREGAHFEHVSAIATARGGSADDVSTCLVCHPNPGSGSNHQPGTGAGDFANAAEVWNDGHGAWTVGSFGNLSTDGVDSNGAYNHTTNTCSNIDCHSGTTTPDWYSPGFVDTTPPYWPSGDGLTAADSTTGGEVVVSWSAATDAASLPIRYDLYRNSTCTGAPIATATNLVATSFTDTGLTNNTLYNYCVRAKDAWTPYVEANNSVISTTPTSATPTLVVWTGSSTNMTYKLVSTTTAVSLGGISTGVKVCGTRLNGSWPTTWPAFYTGLLVPDATNYTCGTASTNNAVLSNVSQTGPRFGVQHFLQNAYTKETTVTGQNNAAGFDIYVDIASTSSAMQMYFARLSPAGVIDQTVGPLGSSSALSTAFTRETANPSTLSITVPAGYRFGLVVGVNEVTGSTASPALSLDTYNATVTNNASVMVTEVQASQVETTPPVFAGPLSAVDAASGGTVNLSWSAGTDTSLPIRYRVWWSTGVINYGAAPNATTTATQLTASGLTNGVLHNFGVRAVDAQNNLNTTQITATATPTAAPVANDCYACHAWPQTTGAHAKHNATTNPLINNAPCVPCHGSLSGYTTAHSNGTLDLPTVAYSGEPTPGVVNGTCTNISCHFNAPTPAWNTTGISCTACHQMPPISQAGVVDHDASVGMVFADFLTAHDQCRACHGKNSTGEHANYVAGSHGDGSVQMNGPDSTPGPAAGTEYDDSNGGCSYACHLNDLNHQLPQSSTRGVKYGDYGLGACGFCHETGLYSAPAVPAAGLHAGSCDQCHPLHKVKDATKQVLIPNNTGVGINYATHGGIFLGGTGTKSGGWATANTPTEAEICWGCHDTQGISEWGVNNNAQTGSLGYDYGSVSTSNWRTATWTSGTALFSYKTAAIRSTHAASTAGGAVKGIDPLAAIRCSYCHDVHDRNLAAGDGTSGQPYLRGSWRGNPYPEDGAPQTGSVYPAFNITTNPWGAVPRGGPVAGTATGGYYIDQNSGNPVVTAGWTATVYGGLCDLCHGTTKNGVFTSAEVNVLNQYDAVGVGWVSGANGHVNSVGVAASGGGSHNATATTGGLNNQGNNIFAGRGGANTQTSTSASHPFMLFNGTSMPGDSAGGFRGVDSQFGFTPAMGGRPMDGDGWINNQWGNLTGRTLALTGTTVDPAFHSFSCSKCHNPHASRLPALMITNCLDTRHNAWDNGFQLNTATDTLALNRAISNWTSAQNCHRLGGVDTNAASPTYDSRADVSTVTTTPGNAGWNTVTPWQQ